MEQAAGILLVNTVYSIIVLFNYHKMEKGLRIGEFIISLVVLIGMGVAAWVNVKTSQATQAEQIRTLENQMSKADAKQEQILNVVNDIKIILERKQDK